MKLQAGKKGHGVFSGASFAKGEVVLELGHQISHGDSVEALLASPRLNRDFFVENLDCFFYLSILVFDAGLWEL